MDKTDTLTHKMHEMSTLNHKWVYLRFEIADWQTSSLDHSRGHRTVNQWQNDRIYCKTDCLCCYFNSELTVNTMCVVAEVGWGLENTGGAGLGRELKATLTPTAGRHAALAQLLHRGGHPLGMDLLQALPINEKHNPSIPQDCVFFFLVLSCSFHYFLL